MKSRGGAVDHEDARGAVSRTALLDKVQRQRNGRSAGAEHEQMTAAASEVAWAEDGIQAQATGDRVGGAANQLAVILGNAGNFLGRPRVGAKGVEQIGSGCRQVDLVRGDERAQRQRLALDVRDHLPITFRRSVNLQVDARQHNVGATESLHP